MAGLCASVKRKSRSRCARAVDQFPATAFTWHVAQLRRENVNRGLVQDLSVYCPSHQPKVDVNGRHHCHRSPIFITGWLEQPLVPNHFHRLPGQIFWKSSDFPYVLDAT
jgi:hypothetical protein